MPVPTNLNDLMLHLEEQGVISLRTPLRALVEPDALKAANPSSLPTDIIIGPRYVYVTIENPADLNGVAKVAEAIRATRIQG